MDLNTAMSMPILFNFDRFQGLHRTKTWDRQKSSGNTHCNDMVLVRLITSIALELVGIFLDHFESINGH